MFGCFCTLILNQNFLCLQCLGFGYNATIIYLFYFEFLSFKLQILTRSFHVIFHLWMKFFLWWWEKILSHYDSFSIFIWLQTTAACLPPQRQYFCLFTIQTCITKLLHHSVINHTAVRSEMVFLNLWGQAKWWDLDYIWMASWSYFQEHKGKRVRKWTYI